MKKVILFILFLSFQIYAVQGEIIVKYTDGVKRSISVKFTPYGQLWRPIPPNANYTLYNVGESNNSQYSSNKYDAVNNSTRAIWIDAPNSKDGAPLFQNNHFLHLDWGYFAVEISSYSTTRTFYLDLRDENWPASTDYGDTYIFISSNGNHFYLTSPTNNNIEITQGMEIKIWEYWSTLKGYTITPNQSNLDVAVFPKNIIAGYDNIGQLVLDNTIYNSGERVTLPDPGIQNNQLYINYTVQDIRDQNGIAEKYVVNDKIYYPLTWYLDNLLDINYGNPFSEIKEFNILATNRGKKEIDRHYEVIHKLQLKNNVEGQALGEIKFKNPIESLNYETITLNGDPFELDEAFDNLDITINSTPNQKYSVYAANNSIISDGVTFNYVGGDFGVGLNNAKEIMLNGPATYEAIYKAANKSSISSAFGSSSRRKVVKTSLASHKVYESMGYIWYEKKLDNGTWDIANGGQPLGKGKSPSITTIINPSSDKDASILIAYQNYTSTENTLELVYFPFNTTLEPKYEKSVTFDQSLTDFEPTISTYESSFFVAAKSVPFFGSAISYTTGSVTGNSIVWDDGTSPVFNTAGASTSSATNLTSEAGSTSGSEYRFHLAWQEGNTEIRYQYFDYNSSTKVVTAGSVEHPDDITGFTENTNPSFVVLGDGKPRLVWRGKRTYGQNPDDPGKVTNYTVVEQMVLRGRPGVLNAQGSYWNTSTFKFGSNVKDVQINKSNDGNYIMTYSNNIHAKKFVTNADFNTIHTFSNTTGYGTQIINASTRGEMSLFTVDNDPQKTTPYDIVQSSTVVTPAKVNSADVLLAREGIITSEDLQLYFILGDILVDGESISFPEYDVMEVPVNADLLKTNKFTLTDNSDFSLGIDYGIVYGNEEMLGEDGAVNFKVELIDANTEALIGQYNSLTIDAQTEMINGSNNYQIDPNGLGTREVYLRMRIDNNFDASTSISTIVSQDEIIGKDNNFEVSAAGELEVTEYGLAQNYPNPFNPSTTINYQIPEAGIVTIKIFDILGREVTTLVNEQKAQGVYTVNFNAASLASGVYLYNIQVNDYSATRKMILMK